MLNKHSGLYGISGVSSDMRELLRPRAAAATSRATLAFDMFCYRVRKYIGAYAAAMGGVDAVVFTGGIGENSPDVRSRRRAGLEFMGLELDAARNAAAARGEEVDVSKPGVARAHRGHPHQRGAHDRPRHGARPRRRHAVVLRPRHRSPEVARRRGRAAGDAPERSRPRLTPRLPAARGPAASSAAAAQAPPAARRQDRSDPPPAPEPTDPAARPASRSASGALRYLASTGGFGRPEHPAIKL